MKKTNQKAPRMVLSFFAVSCFLFVMPLSQSYANTGRGEQSSVVSLSKPVFVENTRKAEAQLAEFDTKIDANQQLQKECVNNCVVLEREEARLKKEKKAFIETNRLPLVSILGGPGYMPETGFMFALGGLYSFSTDRDSDNLQRSSVSLVAIGNEMESGIGFGLRSKQNLFFQNNDIRYVGSLSFGNQSQYYWGTGYDKGKVVDASDDMSLDYKFVNYDANLTFRTNQHWYVGPVLRVRYCDPSNDDLPTTALADDNFQTYRDKPFSIGAGFTVQYDTRDVTVNAWQGSFLGIEFVDYNSFIGSDNDYSKASVDYRYYYALSKGKVLALFNKLQWSQGDVPFYDMPTLGGQDSMRGIYQGRYRDNIAIENTLEYRWTLRDGQDHLTKHGVTFWAGVGSVDSSLDELYSNFLYSYGVGYRYEIQPRMNVRVDLGIGSNNDKGFYLTFTEAF
ncbi:BamA/TamA family outer membrane protein [Vibrio mediterranei]|uniref:BamA/TamA family outer membrane protein n=1 Tax=Vibrio mediterranei TaxID=689 RepID=UPI00156C5748|nr:BamA/TamA family outer membrane protein [Vibrio mediterranei]